MKDKCITTVDNPFSPITQFNEWYAFDTRMGYFTCERLASICHLSDELSIDTNEQLYMEACKELIKTGAINKDGETVEYVIVERQKED